MSRKIECAFKSINCADEEISGNLIEILRDGEGVTALLADGEGDGTGASITASFLIRMALYLLETGETVTKTVSTVAETYADPSVLALNPPGLCAVRMTTAGQVTLAGMNMPEPVVLFRGRQTVCDATAQFRGGARLYQTAFSARVGTSLVLFNDGLLQAGERTGTRWGYGDITAYLQAAYKPRTFLAPKITELLINAAGSLENGKPGHDMSVLALQLTDGPDGETDAV